MMMNCLFFTFYDFGGFTQCFSKAAGVKKKASEDSEDMPSRKAK